MACQKIVMSNKHFLHNAEYVFAGLKLERERKAA